MKYAFLTLVLAVTALSAQAQRRDNRRPLPFPNVNSVCIYNMEAKWDTNRFRRGEVVDTYTEFGPRACLMAEDSCERARLNRRRSYNFECRQEFRTRPVRRSCDYKIETRFGLRAETYTAFGRFACEDALDSCERDLKRLRSLGPWNGGVGPRAACVKTSGNRPAPTPRTYTKSCTAAQFAGRIRRNTGIEFTEIATARSEHEARQRACDSAMSVCQSNLRGRMSCDIVR